MYDIDSIHIGQQHARLCSCIYIDIMYCVDIKSESDDVKNKNSENEWICVVIAGYNIELNEMISKGSFDVLNRWEINIAGGN